MSPQMWQEMSRVLIKSMWFCSPNRAGHLELRTRSIIALSIMKSALGGV